ncbi:hypothetical protein SFRURICE_015535 [Spodoptera frugiperda]|nr:hypothetical protein SFRURICE_015535 [Spodoptera frugiperda]
MEKKREKKKKNKIAEDMIVENQIQTDHKKTIESLEGGSLAAALLELAGTFDISDMEHLTNLDLNINNSEGPVELMDINVIPIIIAPEPKRTAGQNPEKENKNTKSGRLAIYYARNVTYVRVFLDMFDENRLSRFKVVGERETVEPSTSETLDSWRGRGAPFLKLRAYEHQDQQYQHQDHYHDRRACEHGPCAVHHLDSRAYLLRFHVVPVIVVVFLY